MNTGNRQRPDPGRFFLPIFKLHNAAFYSKTALHIMHFSL